MEDAAKRIRELFNYLMENSEDFRKYVEDSEDKTLEELEQEAMRKALR